VKRQERSEPDVFIGFGLEVTPNWHGRLECRDGQIRRHLSGPLGLLLKQPVCDSEQSSRIEGLIEDGRILERGG
jgi:hypothetical protein